MFSNIDPTIVIFASTLVGMIGFAVFLIVCSVRGIREEQKQPGKQG